MMRCSRCCIVLSCNIVSTCYTVAGLSSHSGFAMTTFLFSGYGYGQSERRIRIVSARLSAVVFLNGVTKKGPYGNYGESVPIPAPAQMGKERDETQLTRFRFF